jgi:hypothetical protein
MVYYYLPLKIFLMVKISLTTVCDSVKTLLKFPGKRNKSRFWYN